MVRWDIILGATVAVCILVIIIVCARSESSDEPERYKTCNSCGCDSENDSRSGSGNRSGNRSEDVHVLSEGVAHGYGAELLEPIVARLFPGKRVVWHAGKDRSTSEDYALAVRGPFRSEEPALDVGPVPTVLWSGEPFDPEPPKGRTVVARIRTAMTDASDDDVHLPYALFKDMKRVDATVDKPKFLAYMNSNCKENREKLFAALLDLRTSSVSPDDQPDGLGKCSTTTSHNAPGSWTSSRNIYTPYRFVFAMENSKVDGYVTEKIANAFEARSIPIFWGDSAEARRLFNPKAFLDVSDFESLEEAAAHIVRLDESPAARAAMAAEPMLNERWSEHGVRSWDELRDFYVDKVAAFVAARLAATNGTTDHTNAPLFDRFVTFGVDGAKPMSKQAGRVRTEAEAMPRIFGDVVAHTEWPDWALEHRWEWNRGVPLGAGYWFWKPLAIQEQLRAAPEGGAVVYADAGCTLRAGPDVRGDAANGSIAGWPEWRASLEGHDALLFRMDAHLERAWTTRHAADAMGATPQDMDSPQLAATAVFVRNTAGGRRLVDAWAEAVGRPDLLEGEPSGSSDAKDFREHRHDQSLLSLLAKAGARDGWLALAVRSVAEIDDERSPLHAARLS